MTHPTDRVRRHGRRSRPVRRGSPTPAGAARRRGVTVLRLLLVALFTAGLATLTPGLAQAEQAASEQVTGTLRTSLSGPLEDVEVVVTDAGGDEVGTDETDENGRFAVDLPGPGEYTVTVPEDALPEGVEFNAGNSRTVTVDAGRTQGVIIGLDDGTRGAGGGTIRWVELLVSGLRFGLLIAMAAIGLSLIFGTTGLVNFAHGELVTIGAVVAWFINVGAGVPLIVSALLAMLVGAGIGALNELGLWRPLRRRGTGLVAALVISIGLSLLLRYLYQIVYGGRSNAYADYRGQRTVDYGPFSMTNKDLTSMIIALVVLVLVAVMLQRTTIGKAMRAVSDNRDLAASSGINVNRVILVVWMVGGALAALGGVLLGLSDEVQWDMGFRLLLLMFAGVTLGGLGTAYGALIGSIVVGVFVQMSTLVIPNDMKYVGGLLLLIVILIVRPQGILGSRARIG
ncbi:branched-chain amino acid ABC transporter permease [Blastococcus sp. MG754426]|uniref:branched-chain amino acid ABC transporter permease n=1 Tax=unclassified Blastococcus TaxID=2619396 RepID=UPI001EF02257|nr:MULTISPECIES: branched-chain amino acid ABC transporter permease [unclassified Blastococcus]MCF6507517.1 branched-chain amino acid ABC transporter permease [Blastococcus sp. MG754426]MCF6512099.1 branched-chain amino acid ABC transporter permease [Blastococcus sp. MG754427]MCF6735094.1 branched-chain amino acid ABC transporter permease [Blastococcus sp. KM273129]